MVNTYSEAVFEHANILTYFHGDDYLKVNSDSEIVFEHVNHFAMQRSSEGEYVYEIVFEHANTLAYCHVEII